MPPSDLSSFLDGGTGQPGGADAKVVVNKRYEVFCDQPLPELHAPTAMAYSATDKRDARSDLVAYVCRPGLPPRSEILGALRGVEAPALMRLRDYGAVRWPADQAHRAVVLFDRPAGRRMTTSLGDRLEAVLDETITRNVIQPALQVFKELKARRVFHGCINPLNMFLKGGANGGIVFGECATAPDGYNQPLIFETIERGMAMPAGRGPGTVADDLYALGVLILFLALGRNPAGNMTDEQILQAKLDRGSYAALVGDSRVSAMMTEPVRGLLLDDTHQRWSLEDLDLWLSGRRLSPKQPQPARRAQRPLTFAGRDFFTARALAFTMNRLPVDAIRIIENGELDTWLRRSMEDDGLADRVEEGQRSAASGSGGTLSDRRLARVLMALDPRAPIRYREIAAMPEGIGVALAEAMSGGDHTQELAEMIGAQLPIFWVNMQDNFSPEYVPVVKSFETARSYLERAMPGFGIERVLYHLNPSLPCASPVVASYYPQELDALMYALEDVAGKPDRPAEPVDRHIMAFILSRHGGVSDRSLIGMSPTGKPIERVLGVLDVLFDVQRKCRAFPLPKLCGWVASLMEPAIERYRSGTLRDRVRSELEKQAESGALKNLYVILQNNNLTQRDSQAFTLAKREYRLATKVIQHRQRELDQREKFVTGIGRQAAAVVASLLSAVILAGIVVAGVA